MDYSFEVTNYEEEMKNYFKGVSGRHIKDTLFMFQLILYLNILK